MVGGDPVLQFLEQRSEADPKQLVVGKLTEPLRAIYTKINGVGQEECLLDPVSMIVSMNKKVTVQLGLVWDARALTMFNKLCQLMQHLSCQGRSPLLNSSCQIGRRSERTSTI